jgi:acyl-CoA synthetase (NDP forming)
MTAQDGTIGRTAMDALFAPRSVAIIGASADPTKTGGRPVSYLKKHGFSGAIYPVNPKVIEISGLACFPSVADIPETPDVGIVLLGAERAHLAVRELAQRGTKAAIVLASGYGETGTAGAARQRQLIEAAGSMRLLGPNTIGSINLSKGIVLSASGALEIDDLPVGRISVASQSGGILGSLLSRGAARGIGFSKLASTGNEADIDIADLIDSLARDPETGVIAAYVEGIRSPDKFRRAAQLARDAGKPIVLYKVGRSESGARSAVSHTGAMAGEDRVYDALFRQLGILRAETFSDLLDLPAMLATGRTMHGPRVAILTSTGGAGSLVADNCGVNGLDVPLLDAQTAGTLATLLDGDGPSTSNPVDVTLAGVRPDVMTTATETLLAADDIDAVVVVVGSSALAQPNVATDAIVTGARKSQKPLIAYVSPNAPEILRLLNLKSVPAFSAPETCAVALRSAWAISSLASGPAGVLPAGSNVDACAGLPSGVLNEAEARDLFARFGVPGADQHIVSDAGAAKEAARALGGSVVLKVLSRQIAHKSDVGGVRISLGEADIGPALDEMRARLSAGGLPTPEGFLVQKMLKGGVEMILGFRRDPQLGPLVLLGAGGIAAEVFDDVSIRLLPITEADARGMVDDLRTARLLKGYRGAASRDVEALVQAILGFSRMGEALGERLVEAEINPLFVMPDGEGVAAADALAVLS